jgi:hypothetical protein
VPKAGQSNLVADPLAGFIPRSPNAGLEVTIEDLKGTSQAESALGVVNAENQRGMRILSTRNRSDATSKQYAVDRG